MTNSRRCAIALCVVASLCVGTASAADIVVGGSSGWNNGVTYAPLTAQLGDNLVFNYQTGRHNVLQVTSLSCTALSNAITVAATTAATPVVVPANTTGVRYYSCSVGSHCEQGQLLQVTITAPGTSAAPAPVPANAPGVSPVRIPAVAPAPARVPTPAPAPGPGKSASAPATAPTASGAPAPGSAVTPRRLASYLMG